MKYDERCPVCGAMNKNLNLDETNGWFECENCKAVVNTMRAVKKVVQIPLYEMKSSTGVKPV